MFAIALNNSFPRRYKNNGQHAEQVFTYTLTGELVKADNIAYTDKADVLDYQVKSARATVCVGTNLQAHIANDAAKAYAYVMADFSKAYIMSPAEWLEFGNTFGTITRDSKSNGSAEKIRLKSESKALIGWLQARA